MEVRAGTIKPQKGQEARQFGLDGNDLVIDGYRVTNVPIATDAPVMRSFGEERLVVTNTAIEIQDSIPLLLNHNPNSRRLGSVTNPKIVDGVLRADVEFDENYDVAREVFDSLRAGQKQDLSISYLPRKYEVKRMGETLAESHLVTDYQILDVSVVGRGADSKSGFYRSACEECNVTRVTDTVDDNSNSNQMTKEVDKTKETEVSTASDVLETRSAIEPKEVVVNLTDAQRRSERAAVAELFTLAETHSIDMATAKGWVSEGIGIAEAKDRVLTAIAKRSAETPAVRFTDAAPKEDEKSYKDGKVELSMRGAIDALIANQLGERNYSPEASLAMDVSKQLGGGQGLKMRVPYEALSTRAFEASATKQGQALITDVVRMDQLQKFLYNNTVTGKLGLNLLTGLVDDVSIPRVTKSVSASYYAEAGAATSADMETNNVKLSPKTAIALTKVTNLAKAQIPGVQNMLQDDLLAQIRIAVDRTTLIGGGTNEPTGIMATTGVNTARTGNSNSATRKFNLDEIITQIGKIQDANVIGNPKIVAPPSLINYWRKQKDSDGQYLWSANTDMTTVMDVPGYLFGLPVYRTTNLRNSGDAATDFRLIIGVFDYAYQAFWGNSFDLEIGYSGDDFSRDQASIRCVVYHDAAVTRPNAFESFTKIEV